MLTKEDLSAIEKVLDRKLEEKLETKLEEKLKPIKFSIKKIQNDQKAIISLFDKEYLDLEKRVTKIEDHLQLTPTN